MQTFLPLSAAYASLSVKFAFVAVIFVFLLFLSCKGPGAPTGISASTNNIEAGKKRPMHFTIGNDVGLQVMPFEEAKAAVEKIAAGAEAARVTAFEPYVKWMLLEPQENKWDFSYFDMQLTAYGRHGIRWVPFLIAGPAYATPEWFKESKEAVFARCLEHGQETRTQSIWNPHLRERVKKLLQAFARHFDHKQIQSLLLGISGDFGESIYTVAGNKWTYIWDGEYHHHGGWWCDDDYAKRDFQQAMQRKYGDIEALNREWEKSFTSFSQILPFIPDGSHTRRARLDMTRWYRGSMTDYTEFWLKSARKYLPGTQVLICTGGDGRPKYGADFSGQAIMAARNKCGIRITNEASDYAENFILTRWVGSACRNLGCYFGYEPAGAVNEKGIVARIYNAVASGADELFVYDNPPAGERGAVYERYRHLLVKRRPQVPVAVFLSKTSQELQLWGKVYQHASQFRDYSDFDFIDESLIGSGFLERYKVLVWTDGPVTEKETLASMEAWVKEGGLLFCRVRPETVEGEERLSRLKEYPTVHAAEGEEITKFYESIVRAAPEMFPDGKADNVYWTHFKDGSALVLNFSDKPYHHHKQTVEPGQIGEFEGKH